jgi:hypothetical protein
MKRARKDGDEQDAFSKYRHVHGRFSKPGVVKKIKKRANKRDRREGKNINFDNY